MTAQTRSLLNISGVLISALSADHVFQATCSSAKCFRNTESTGKRWTGRKVHASRFPSHVRLKWTKLQWSNTWENTPPASESVSKSDAPKKKRIIVKSIAVSALWGYPIIWLECDERHLYNIVELCCEETYASYTMTSDDLHYTTEMQERLCKPSIYLRSFLEYMTYCMWSVVPREKTTDQACLALDNDLGAG